jgi:hypothetical protein
MRIVWEKERNMNQQDFFVLATNDKTLWEGYAEWLDEQDALATYERLHEEFLPEVFILTSITA